MKVADFGCPWLYILGDEAMVAMTDYKYDSASYDKL